MEQRATNEIQNIEEKEGKKEKRSRGEKGIRKGKERNDLRERKGIRKEEGENDWRR